MYMFVYVLYMYVNNCLCFIYECLFNYMFYICKYLRNSSIILVHLLLNKNPYLEIHLWRFLENLNSLNKM